MIKVYQYVKNEYETIFYRILFYLSFYITTLFFYLTYSVIDSPDLAKYYKYFEFYSGSITAVGLEQGHIYFFLNYFIAFTYSLIYDFFTLNEILNIAVHTTNSFIFLFGCMGIKKCLAEKYDKKNIYLVLAILCFLPPSFQLRVTFKPEILAFACLGWLFLYLSKIYQNDGSINIIKFILLFSLVITSKISIAFLITVILLLEIFINKRKVISKLKLTHFLIFLLIVSSLSIENTRMNDKFINQVEHEEKYNNTVDLSFFTKFDQNDFIDNPNKYFFYDSFIGITMFDSFNDFFGLYNNSEHTELNIERKQFFKVVFRGGQVLPLNMKFDKNDVLFSFSGLYDRGWNEKNYIDETRMKTSFIFSLIVYFLLLLFAIFKKSLRIIFVSPFIGIFVVSVSALGFFGTNNYDPNTGDSFKTFYYGYLLLFAFSFLLSQIFEKKLFKKTISIVLVLLMLFFLGFPFKYSQQTEEMIIDKNSQILTCKYNYPVVNLFLNVNEKIKCDKSRSTKNLISPDSYMPPIDFGLKKIPFINIFVLFTYLLLFSSKINRSKLVSKL